MDEVQDSMSAPEARAGFSEQEWRKFIVSLRFILPRSSITK
jgi:hypothetical protein